MGRLFCHVILMAAEITTLWCNTLDAFILCGFLASKDCMATCLPYKSAWMPILDVPIIDNLRQLTTIHFLLLIALCYVASYMHEH